MMGVLSVLVVSLCVWVPLVLCELSSVEQQFISYPSADLAREHLKFYTSIEHVAGTLGDYETALYTLNKFKEYGLDAHIEPFKALLAYPNEAKLSLIGGPDAQLAEDIVAVDPTSDSILRNHTYHGYSPSGNVTGELVFINYGLKEDFEYVTNELGIDLTGKIALVKYGRNFRGLKVLNAQNHGMLACLIYSDPIDDGFSQGKTYPDGSWRPESGVQRGSVQFNSRCGGDPGLVDRDPDICGFKTEDLIPKIPSLPLSYGDAKVIFGAI
jgi:N-acetylated-alpha-linked acidic dipeptidase